MKKYYPKKINIGFYKENVGKYTLLIMRLAGWYNNWLFSYIAPHLNEEILEVGAGIGNFTELLSQRRGVTAIDINKKYLPNLIKTYKNVFVGYGDIEKGRYFFNDKSFDTIVCLNVLEHVKRDKKALKNMFKLLNPKGKLILLVPAHMFLYSKIDKNLGHFRRYSKDNLTQKIKNNKFKIIDARYINWWAAIGWFIFMKIAKRNTMPESGVGIFNLFGRFLLLPEKYMKLPFGLSILIIAQK